MSEKKMAMYAKAMNRLQPNELLNKRVIQRVNEDVESAPEIVVGLSGRMLQPKHAPRVSEKPHGFAWKASSRTVSIAASMLMVLLLTVGGYHMVLTPTTWIDVDINPSVELGFNRMQRVVKVDGVNEDGEALLKQISLFGNKPEAAVQSIVEAASRMGYLTAGEPNVVALTVIAEKPEQEKTLATKIRSGADTALETEGLSAEIVEQSMKPERVQRAQALRNDGVDISPGKLNLIEKLGEIEKAAEDAGVEVVSVPEVDMYTFSVKDIQAKTNEYRRAMKEKGETGNASAPGQLKQEDKETGKETAPGQQKKGNGTTGNVTAPGQMNKENGRDDDMDIDAADMDKDDDDDDMDINDNKDVDVDVDDDDDNDVNDDDNDDNDVNDDDNDEDDDTAGRNGTPGKGPGSNDGGNTGSSSSGGSGNGQ